MHETATAPTSAEVTEPQPLPRSALYATVAGLMLTLLLSALDQTIVGTAMPRVVSELHGFEHYAWVTTAYLLTSTTVVPIVGRLSDLYGRRWFLLGGTGFFLVTSALCGLSQDMTQLVVFRGLQGLGGGVLMATVLTVISTLFPPAQRARMQGLFSAVFGLASIVGPLLGGYLTDQLSWRWVFYVNLPVGLVALSVLWLFYRDVGPRRMSASIDYVGAATLTAGVVPLLLALSWGGTQYAWLSPPILGLLLVAVLMLAAFVWTEAHATEPILPLPLFRNRVLAVSALAIGILGVTMFGTILYIPLFVQGVIGTTATQSGSVLAPMMFAMIASSIAGGQIIARTGKYKMLALGGLAVTTLGMLLLSGMGPDTDYTTAVRNMIVIGCGLGPVMPVFTLASQSAVQVEQIGVATSLTQFSRSIGGTLGTAIFGSLLTNRFGSALARALPADVLPSIPPPLLAQFQNPQALLNPQAAEGIRRAFASLGPQGAQLYGVLLGAVKVGLAEALHDVFLAGAGAGAVGVVTVLFLREVPLRRSFAARGEPAAVASLPPVRPRDEPVVVGRRRAS